jgi:hypothetical protein
MSIASAQGDTPELTDAWKQVHQEAMRLAGEAEKRNPEMRQFAQSAIKSLAARGDRSTISELFDGIPAVETMQMTDELKDVRGWMKFLAHLLLFEISDPENRAGMIRTEGWERGAGPYNYSPEELSMFAVAAMSIYGDAASREWLFEVAMSKLGNPDENSEYPYVVQEPYYYALQLLRGHQEDDAMRTKLRELLSVAPTVRQVPMSKAVSRRTALQSVLASWDFAASLDEAVVQRRFREFQSQLWRFHGIVAIRTRGSREGTSQYRSPADLLAKNWQPGDERFVLHIFEEPASTSDELRIAEYLAHKLPDTAMLKAIAESNSPNARHAQFALQRIVERARRQR